MLGCFFYLLKGVYGFCVVKQENDNPFFDHAVPDLLLMQFLFFIPAILLSSINRDIRKDDFGEEIQKTEMKVDGSHALYQFKELAEAEIDNISQRFYSLLQVLGANLFYQRFSCLI